MSVNLQHFLLSAAKAADPQRLFQTNLQHFLLSVTAAADQQPLRRMAENAVNSQTCYDLARKLRLNRHLRMCYTYCCRESHIKNGLPMHVQDLMLL